MPQVIKNDDGTETTVFTADEVEAQKNAAVEVAVKESPVVKQLQTDLDAMKVERDALANKDMNFANVKDALTKKDTEIAELGKKIEEAKTVQVTEARNEVLDQLSNGDADLKAKIEAEMKTFRDQPTTKAEILALAHKALAIVRPAAVPGAFDNFSAANRGAAGAGQNGGKEFVPSPELASIGNKMGLSDEDWKKYGGGLK